MKRAAVATCALACVLLAFVFAGCGSSSNGAAGVTPTPVPSSTVTPTPTATPSATPTATPSAMQECFPQIDPFDPVTPSPNYDQYAPQVGAHCQGTHHQEISGIEKVVFLGDSITEGTPPSWPWEAYRWILTEKLRERFGATLEVSNCAKWGARTDDFLGTANHQLLDCFPSFPIAKRTLVIFTMGGNDIASFSKQGMEGVPIPEILVQAEAAGQLMREAVDWLKEPGKFPNGVSIVFGNMYEFTDGLGDPSVCPAASIAGFGQPWPEGRPVFLRFNEAYMRTAVETQTDMVFMLERFCGHGYNAQNPASECFQAPGGPTWFDLTCIHPNPAGHAQLADMFMAVIDGN